MKEKYNKIFLKLDQGIILGSTIPPELNLCTKLYSTDLIIINKNNLNVSFLESKLSDTGPQRVLITFQEIPGSKENAIKNREDDCDHWAFWLCSRILGIPRK